MEAAGERNFAAIAAAWVNTASAAIELYSLIKQALIVPTSDKGGELFPMRAFWKLSELSSPLSFLIPVGGTNTGLFQGRPWKAYLLTVRL